MSVRFLSRTHVLRAGLLSRRPATVSPPQLTLSHHLPNSPQLQVSQRFVTTDATASQTDTAKIPQSADEHFTINLAPEAFETYNLDPLGLEMDVTRNELIQMYQNMVIIRRMEMASDALYKAKKIRGFHLSTGQEAVAVGIEHSITKEDQIITAYRCHGFTYMRGGTVKSIIAELLGRRDGVSYGKGGSMHMFVKGFFGGNGIVGAQVPVGAGIGFALKYMKKEACCFALYGDGAANQGQVFEAFNMASLWKLPVVFGCENNKYGMGTAASRSSAMTEYYQRGQYIPGIKVNGMDVLAVAHASKFARDYTISGKGPLVMEFVTYRYGGHSMSDPGTTYRTREEIQNMRSSNDAIQGLKSKLLEWGIVSENELKEIDKEARKKVDNEVTEAEKSPEPEATPKNLFEDIYVRGTEPPAMRGRIVEENYSY